MELNQNLSRTMSSSKIGGRWKSNTTVSCDGGWGLNAVTVFIDHKG